MDKQLIYVVEDEEPLRELYTYTLESYFDVLCFADATEFLSAIKVKSPDLIILDIMLDGMNGFDILKTLKSSIHSNIPVIMVSAKGEEISKVKGLNLGASDYIAKPFGVLELVARIKANLRKSTLISTSRFGFKDIVVDDEKHMITVCEEELALTLKEYKLLKIFVQNSEKVILRDNIFSEVWGENFIGETRTLDVHIKGLRKKIADSVCNIETIRGVGYVLK